MKKGKVIVFEGMDGAGKSTAIGRFCQYLEQNRVSFLRAREPGTTPAGEAISQLTKSTQRPVSTRAQSLLFVAARIELVDQIIRPALMEGKTIVLDRFYPTNFAYSPRKNWSYLWDLHYTLGLFDIPIDLYLLDIDKATYVHRMQSRTVLDEIEKELESAFDNYKSQYDSFIGLLSETGALRRFKRIDGTSDAASVSDQIIQDYEEGNCDEAQ